MPDVVKFFPFLVDAGQNAFHVFMLMKLNMLISMVRNGIWVSKNR